ncbi:response regulator transcription factor [Bradyrhizobium sp. CCGUVB14]|uniref:response regulator n=1 Tax=Bradyrhizobium sp. CCGUVB14 TaxID=2949628 RepID=UPI0020B2C188|nr:response regulator transcription factor [Bradyrhizobium sp. CCGUVB14]MCP3443745.1 response regulator transcription factor [Bradyrhizobium sp. CCGUVB14]
MSQIRVILAEDHPEMAQHLQALLDSRYHVDVVSDGQTLIEAASLQRPDLIITDIAMPGVNGLIAARRVLATHPKLPIVFVTVLDEPAIIRRSLADGARGYVVKSDAGDELADAIDAVLAGDSYVSSSARAALGDSPGSG